ncbi:hypothetical protein HPB50_000276 [Hyalomma asiaticum]|uniref:Uncharacterized protein n=1 Tax=Hyalomma asiaticum TaxID=266040 RepID=A0ACB7S6D5_HYAAI|nr:hypothetical protein HPB50_000276 [Hyalomma asiaticum]
MDRSPVIRPPSCLIPPTRASSTPAAVFGNQPNLVVRATGHRYSAFRTEPRRHRRDEELMARTLSTHRDVPAMVSSSTGATYALFR